MKYITTVGYNTFEIEIEGHGTVVVDDQPLTADLREIVSGRLYSLLLENASHETFVESVREDWQHRYGGSHFRVLLKGQLYRV